MKNKLFDDFVQKQFDGYKPEVAAHIWENIARKKEKQKPIGFWFSTIGKVAATFLVLLSCIGVGYYFMQSKNTPAKEISINKKENISPTINSTQENSSTTVDKNKETLLPIAKPIQLKQPLSKIINSTNKNNIVLESRKNNTPSAAQKIINDNITSTVKKDRFANGNTVINIFKSEKEISIKNALVATITNADFINQNRLFSPTVTKKKLPAIAFIPCPEAEKYAAGNKKYIEVYGGPDYIFKNYTDTGASYIALRKSSTGIYYAFSAGLRYTKVFGSGISFRTGLNYSQINERFIAFNGYVLERIVQVNSIGDTISNYTNATIQYKKSTNIYKTIDIPVQAGFEFGNGRLHTNLSAGALINITSKQTGNAVEPNGTVIDLSAAKSDSKYLYKSNIGVSFLGSASVYYNVNEKWHVMFEPYIRYSLSPMTKSEITFSQKFHTAGVRLGVRKDL